MIQWGILGIGNIAKRFIKSLEKSTNGQLYAAASYTESKCEEFLKEHPDVKVYHDYEDLLNDENVDAVYLAMRHIDHYRWAKKALQHHKAVLCEKPATLYKWQMEDLKQEAIKNQTFFMEAMKTRFIPLIQDIKECLENKEIGELLSVETCFCYDRDYLEGHYLFDQEQGGILNDVGSYNVASTLDYIHSPIARINSQVQFRYGVDSHEKVTITFESGQKALMEMAFDEKKDSILEIKGTKGTILAQPFYRPTQATIIDATGTSHQIEKPYINDDFFGEIEEVHRCLQAKLIESPRMSLQDSIDFCVHIWYLNINIASNGAYGLGLFFHYFNIIRKYLKGNRHIRYVFNNFLGKFHIICNSGAFHKGRVCCKALYY